MHSFLILLLAGLGAFQASGASADGISAAGRADWIGYDAVKCVTPVDHGTRHLPAVYLRRAFTSAVPVRAVLVVTAKGVIAPYLNGKPVSPDCFTPGWTDYTKRFSYRTYNVTRLLRAGTNVLAAVLGDGWFRGRIGWWNASNIYGRQLRAWMALVLTMSDGSRRIVATDADWRAATGPILESDMQGGETYDARLEMPGWSAPDFDDSAWHPVVVDPCPPSSVPTAVGRAAPREPRCGATPPPIDASNTCASVSNETHGAWSLERGISLSAHPAPPVRMIAEVPARSIAEPRPGVYVFDFGQNFAGVERLAVDEPAGTRIVMRFAETLQTNGMIYTANLRKARCMDTYICRGGGPEIWSPLFTFHGFRYVEVTGLARKPALAALTGLVLSSDLRRTGFFECSDPSVNRLYSNILWCQRSNYLEVPTDCPQRDERMGWAGDCNTFARTGLYNLDSAAFLDKWLTDMDDGQNPDGSYPVTAPALCKNWSPHWSDAPICVAWEIWRATGDLSVLRRHYPFFTRYMAYCKTRAPGFIGPDEGYGDWLSIGRGTSKPFLATACLAHDFDLMARIADLLGRSADAAAFRADFAAACAAFRARFIARDGRIDHDSQTSYLLPIAFGLLTPDQSAAAAARLAKVVDADPGSIAGVIGVSHLLPVLTETGHADLAYRLLLRRTFPSWLFCVDQGATTIWERWDGYRDGRYQDPGMNSFNHYALGSVGEWLYESVLGIKPLETGYARIRVAPVPGGGLAWAKGSYETPHGVVSVSWSVTNGTFSLSAAVPAGVPATAVLPDGTEHALAGSAVFTCPFKESRP